MALDSHDAWPVIHLAEIYARDSEKEDEAEKLFQKALQLDMANPWPYSGLAQLYVERRHDYMRGETLYRKAIDARPREGSFHAHRALCLLELAREDEARQEAKIAIALGYKGPDPVFDRLHIHP